MAGYSACWFWLSILLSFRNKSFEHGIYIDMIVTSLF